MDNIEIEPKYFFMNEDISVLEVKRTDLNENVDKSKKYQWLKIEDGKIEKLDFKNMKIENINGNDINVREFENSELRFDEDFAKFQEDKGGQLLANVDLKNIPDEVVIAVSNFLVQ